MDRGWYSATQARLGGVTKWTTPDGKTVEVTEVTSGDTKPGSQPDIKCVGEVVQFVDRISEGSLPFPEGDTLEDMQVFLRSLKILRGEIPEDPKPVVDKTLN